VRYIHIAGGKWIKSTDGTKDYLLDDHLHAVDEPVYKLLTEVASRAAQPLTVILERDGAYPELPALLHELDCAREALRAGRKRRTQHDHKQVNKESYDRANYWLQPLPVSGHEFTRAEKDIEISRALAPEIKLEQFLTLLYVDNTLREHFLQHPIETASAHALSPEQCTAIAAICAQDLQTVSDSFAHKRKRKAQQKRSGLREWLQHILQAGRPRTSATR